MKSRKEIALDKIQGDFKTLSNSVMSQLMQITEIVEKGEITFSDEELNEINKKELKIDELEVKLSERIIQTIALFHPVAGEIRQIIVISRMINNLERIGDHVIEIIDFIKKIKSMKVYNEYIDVILNMYTASVELVQAALFAFFQQDKSGAETVILNRRNNDNLSQLSLKKLVNKSLNFDDRKKITTSFITIKEMIDIIQRIADHATNIAEATIYYVEGKDIRHQSLSDD